MEQKKRILSGIQPSGFITLGNYLGAVKNWVKMQDEYDCYFFMADLHAITVRQEPAQLRKNSIDMMALILACGIDAEKSPLFFQSHVHTHAELTWVLNNYTQLGELSRMTQFKDKSAKNESNINAGLFTYPVLMAADILLYQTDLVPVGNDQKQHLELSRDIAARFNNAHGDTFKIPEPYIPEVGARIMSLQEPTSKMSKSDPNVNGYISLTDDNDTIIRKFKRAVTDSGSEVKHGEGKEGMNNLLSIYGAVTGLSIEQAEAQFEGKGYGDFKLAVAESVVECLRPIKEKHKYLMENKDFLKQVYTQSAERALSVSNLSLIHI